MPQAGQAEAGLAEAGLAEIGAGAAVLPAVGLTLAERPITSLLPDLNYDSFLDDFDTEVRPLGCEPELLFETSRGCWWGEVSQCTFCGLNGLTMHFRELQADQAVHVISSMFRYRHRCTSLMSVDNIMPRGFTREVLPRLNTPEEISIFYEVKANLRRTDLTTMIKAGLRTIQPGIESLSSQHLRLMRKGTNSFRNIRLLENCKSTGMKVYWNLLVGFPGESKEPYLHYGRQLRNLFHLQPPESVFPIRFDRFSPYFNEAATHGLVLTPTEFYSLIYPYGQSFIEDFAYYFTNVARGAAYQAHLATWLRELQGIVQEWQDAWSRGNPAELVCRSDNAGVRVIDARGGAAREYELRETEAAALQACRSPMRRDRPPRDGGWTQEEWIRALDLLGQQGLIFEDEGRVISLVAVPGRSARVGGQAMATAR